MHGSIGRNCSVSQGVTIGLAGTGQSRGAPTLGDRVYLGPNAIVVGKISVGDDAVICAGRVVTRSVPPRAVVLGNPARVASYEGSFDYVVYDGMEADPARYAALRPVPSAGPAEERPNAPVPGVATRRPLARHPEPINIEEGSS
jgi:serine acetyltransferase